MRSSMTGLFGTNNPKASREPHTRQMKGVFKVFEVYIGSHDTMGKIAQRGATGLNRKTMRYQVIDKTAKYSIVDTCHKDCVSYSDCQAKGHSPCATLYSDKDLRAIAKEKGLIM